MSTKQFPNHLRLEVLDLEFRLDNIELILFILTHIQIYYLAMHFNVDTMFRFQGEKKLTLKDEISVKLEL